MRLTPKKIDFSQGFTQENDLFGRENFAKQLENIIINTEDESLVFGIDDNWGSGKTTFLRMWEGRLNNDPNPKLKIVYFDAFEFDYQQDAFLAIASKIYELLDKKNDIFKKKFIESAKVVGKNLFSMAAKVGINVATAGLVNGSIIEGSADAISGSLTDPLDKFIEDKIKGAKRDEESIMHFKDTLEMISVDKRIIFVIDELDRARPDFSLEILEKIKHVFSAKNFIFILSMNRIQFEKTIIKRYGDIDASLYLSKFITHWFTLPKEPETQIRKSSLSKYCEYLIEMNFNNDAKYEALYESISRLLIIHNCSLREAEKAFGLASLILASVKNDASETTQAAIALVVYINIFHPKKLPNIHDNKMSPADILSLIGVELTSEDSIDQFIIRIINTEYLTDLEYKDEVRKGSELVIHPRGRRPRFIQPMLSHMNNMYIEDI